MDFATYAGWPGPGPPGLGNPTFGCLQAGPAPPAVLPGRATSSTSSGDGSSWGAGDGLATHSPNSPFCASAFSRAASAPVDVMMATMSMNEGLLAKVRAWGSDGAPPRNAGAHRGAKTPPFMTGGPLIGPACPSDTPRRPHPAAPPWAGSQAPSK